MHKFVRFAVFVAAVVFAVSASAQEPLQQALGAADGSDKGQIVIDGNVCNWQILGDGSVQFNHGPQLKVIVSVAEKIDVGNQAPYRVARQKIPGTGVSFGSSGHHDSAEALKRACTDLYGMVQMLAAVESYKPDEYRQRLLEGVHKLSEK